MTTKTLSFVTATLLLTTNTFADETLQDIHITSASKSLQNIQDVTANVSVITAKEIEERGYTTVAQALHAIAGISITQNGGLGQTTSVTLRGMESKRTLVLIDGIQYNDVTGLNGAPFQHIMVDNIAQIEIIKGAQSGVWGADASAGVINIITKKASLGTHGSFHIEGGSFNTKKYGVSLSKKTNTLSIKLTQNIVKSDGYSAQQPQDKDLDSLEDDDYKNTTTSFDLGYQINGSNKIDMSHTIIDASGAYDTFANPNGIATHNTYDTFSTINFNHIDSFNEVNFYVKRSKFDRSFTAPNFSNVLKTTPYRGEVKEYGMTSNIPYAKKDFLLLGAAYKSLKQGDLIQKSFTNKAYFFTNSNHFTGLLGGDSTITESLRQDNYSAFDNKTTGKIGLKQSYKDIYLSINYGTAYNTPTLYQLYSPYGLKTLSPESTTSVDTSIAYKDLSLSYFHTNIKDMIDFDTKSFKYANTIGTSKISGIELSYETDIFSDFLFSLHYTHILKAQDQKKNDLIRRAKDDVKMALDYYGIRDLHLGIDATYIGSRTDIKFNPDFSKTELETGKYTVVNMTANYAINKEVALYGKIENLSDTKYQTVYGYATSPRAFYAGLRAHF